MRSSPRSPLRCRRRDLSGWRHPSSGSALGGSGRPPYGAGMNKEHLEVCASDEGRETLRDLIIPYALADARLGDDVLEVGAGPGLTTDLLRTDIEQITAGELDDTLCARLAERLAGTNVEGVPADATAMPFEDGRFTGA